MAAKTKDMRRGLLIEPPPQPGVPGVCGVLGTTMAEPFIAAIGLLTEGA